jgi:hypothetical protein
MTPYKILIKALKNINMKKYKTFIKLALLSFLLIMGFGCERNLDVEDLSSPSVPDLYNPAGVRQLEYGIFHMYSHNIGLYNYMWPLLLANAAGEYHSTSTAGEGSQISTYWELRFDPTLDLPLICYRALYTSISQANMILEIFDKNLGTISTMPEATKNLVMGTAYFMRGMSYFNLLHAWGAPYISTDIDFKHDYNGVQSGYGVVLHTLPVTNPDSMQKPRSSVRESYAQIESDFTQAIKYLPERSALPAAEIGHPFKASAVAWLGKTLLYEASVNNDVAKFKEAQDQLKLFLDTYDKTGAVGLMEYYGDNFHGTHKKNSMPMSDKAAENNKESLFEIQYADIIVETPWSAAGATGSFYQMFIAATAIGGRNNYNIYPSMLDGFLKRNDTIIDIRFFESSFSNHNLYSLDYNNKSYRNFADSNFSAGNMISFYDTAAAKDPSLFANYPKKYINRNRFGKQNNEGYVFISKDPGVGDENQVVTRIAEIYFLYAEAVVAAGGNTADAIPYLNKVVRRATGYSVDTPCPYDYDAVRDGDLMTYIRNQKRLEFFGEGIRWFDMIRWKIAPEEVLKPGDNLRFWRENSWAWGIPQSETEINTKCEQNPGYN